MHDLKTNFDKSCPSSTKQFGIVDGHKKICGFFSTVLVCLWMTASPGYTQGVTTPLLEVNQPPLPVNRPPIAIVGVRLIDGLGGPPVDDAVVIVKGDRIIAVGPRRSVVEIPTDAERFDAGGKTLMPGLIDAHFHSIMNNGLLNQYLRNGVTTVRDPGHPFRFYQNLHFTEQPAPRVFLTGAHLDGFPPVWPQQAVVVRNADHARRTVHEHVDNGGTGIKIYYRLPLEYYEVITQAAGQRGVPVTAHLELVDADKAIRAGVNGIEHVSSFGTALAAPEEAQKFKEAVRVDDGVREKARYQLWATIDLNSDRVKKVIDLVVRYNAVLSPTLGIFESQAGDAKVEDYQVKGYRNMVRFIEMAHKAGMEIVTGSHVYGVEYADFGWAYQREMELLVEAGMTPMEVIVSSTMGNARYFRTEQRIGSIEPGKLADLLLINGDPTEDISMMYNVHRVMLNGKWIESDY